MNNNRNQLNRSLLAFAALQVMPLSLFAQGERPNILYIMCDDHAMQAISAYGSPISKLAPTPNIDRLAERGMKFNEAFVENSLSTPSRACLMTGLYSHQNGQRQLAEGIDSTKTFFSELLQGAGYSTAVVGKWHMSCSPKGFDYYHVLDDQGQYYNPTFASTGQYGNFKQKMGYATDLITDHAIEYLNNRDKNKPFCLLVHHKAPHRLWMPNTKYVGKYGNVNFPLPETFWDDYETRGSAASTQKMSIDKYMEMVRDLKVPEMYDPSTPEGRDSYAGLMGEINRMTPQQRAIIDAYYMPRNREFLSKELAPLVGEEGAVGLDDIVYLFAVGILLLKCQRLFVEVDGTHQRLASMPGKEYLGHGLCLDVLPGELLQHLIGHQMSGSVLVKMVLFQIITVFASQVAMGACGLQHHIQGLGKWSCYVVVHHFFLFKT